MSQQAKNQEAQSPYLLFAVLFFGMVAVFFLELLAGSVTLPTREVWAFLTGGSGVSPMAENILRLLRLPRAVTALLAGAGLSVAGLMMQTLFRNPLADPFILGISSGASLGVALAVMVAGSTVAGAGLALSGTGISSSISLAVSAFVGAALVFSAVLTVARKIQSNTTLLIFGLLFGYAASALVAVCMHFSLKSGVSAYVVWTFGSFSQVTWSAMRVFAPLVFLGLLVAALLVKPLNALLLGPEYARTMGVSVTRARFLIIASASLLAGVVTAFCGPIGFVGVAVPHLCRGLFRTMNHRILVPASMLAGAGGMALADLAAQVPGFDTVLPLNSVASLLGAPVVIAVILRRRHVMEVSS